MKGIEITFIIIGIVGFAYFLISLFIGELFEGIEGLFDSDIDFDVDGSGGPSFISGRTLAAGMVGFAAGGYLASYGELNTAVVIAIAVCSMLAVMVGSYFLVVAPLYRAEYTDVHSNSTLVGRQATVTLSVRPGESGQVSVVDASGALQRLSATTDGDEVIPVNTNVTITKSTPTGVVISK